MLTSVLAREALPPGSSRLAMAPLVFLTRSARTELITADFWKISRPLRRWKIRGVHALLLQRARLKQTQFRICLLVVGLVLFRPVFAVEQDKILGILQRVLRRIDADPDDLGKVRPFELRRTISELQ